MPWVYPVRIRGNGEPVHIESAASYTKARKTAEEIAKFMDLGISDYSSGEEMQREAGSLDESIRNCMIRDGEEVIVPPLPPLPRIQYSTSGGDLIIDIPPAKLTFKLYYIPMFIQYVIVSGFLLFFLAAFTAGILNMFSLNQSDTEFCWTVIVVILVVATMGIYFVRPAFITGLESMMSSDRIIVSPGELRKEHTSFRSIKSRSIPLDELEELEVRDEVIWAISDRSVFTFGVGLQETEQLSVLGLIKYFILQGRVPEMSKPGVCPQCGRTTEFITTYNSWYCHECRDYV